MIKKCTALWPKEHVKNIYKHGASASEHFWKLRCRKSAWRCGAKYIWTSTYKKNHRFGQLLEVEILKKCTPLWREARSEVKPPKKTIEVETLKQRTPLWHDSHVEIKITSGSEHFWKLWCSKSARRSGTKHISKSKCEKHTMLGPLLEVEMSRCCGAKHISKSTCAKHIMFGLLLKDVCVAGAKWVKT